LPDTDTPPADIGVQPARPDGMDPYEVGRRVLDGVTADERYIMTHPEFRAVVANRHERMTEGFARAESFVI
jgi:hypothetical protein